MAVSVKVALKFKIIESRAVFSIWDYIMSCSNLPSVVAWKASTRWDCKFLKVITKPIFGFLAGCLTPCPESHH